MKFILFFAAFALAVSAQAEVKRPGSFVPDMCGTPTKIGEVGGNLADPTEVCTGYIARKDPSDMMRKAFPIEALEVMTAKGSRSVWMVTNSRYIKPAGHTTGQTKNYDLELSLFRLYDFRGRDITPMALRVISGKVKLRQRLSGQILRIQADLPGIQWFESDNFEFVIVTRSVE